MGPMGGVVGEKVAAAAERAIEGTAADHGDLHGGMMEGMVSLVQMAKTSAAIAKLDAAGGCTWW